MLNRRVKPCRCQGYTLQEAVPCAHFVEAWLRFHPGEVAERKARNEDVVFGIRAQHSRHAATLPIEAWLEIMGAAPHVQFVGASSHVHDYGTRTPHAGSVALNSEASDGLELQAHPHCSQASLEIQSEI